MELDTRHIVLPGLRVEPLVPTVGQPGRVQFDKILVRGRAFVDLICR